MRRRSYSPRRPRTKKIRSPIRIKPRIAKQGGKCDGCKMRFSPGEEITYVIVRKRKFHTHSCVPANVGQLQAAPPGPTLPRSPGEARLQALASLENALVVIAKTEGITPEMEKAFDRFNKLKSVGLRPGSANEGRMGFREATIALVRVVF